MRHGCATQCGVPACDSATLPGAHGRLDDADELACVTHQFERCRLALSRPLLLSPMIAAAAMRSELGLGDRQRAQTAAGADLARDAFLSVAADRFAGFSGLWHVRVVGWMLGAAIGSKSPVLARFGSPRPGVIQRNPPKTRYWAWHTFFLSSLPCAPLANSLSYCRASRFRPSAAVVGRPKAGNPQASALVALIMILRAAPRAELSWLVAARVVLGAKRKQVDSALVARVQPRVRHTWQALVWVGRAPVARGLAVQVQRVKVAAASAGHRSRPATTRDW